MFRSPREVCSRNPRENNCERTEQGGAYCCDFCYDGWDSETEVDIHRNSTHRKEMLDLLKDPNQHICRICYKSYEDYNDLIRHIKTWHLLSSEDAVRVEPCKGVDMPLIEDTQIRICIFCREICFGEQSAKDHICICLKKKCDRKKPKSITADTDELLIVLVEEEDDPKANGNSCSHENSLKRSAEDQKHCN
ncbi:unnamed protein product [Parnassius apollo]|uniref:(apollo) hypothetical protein n=1 Tax=Parnassius apollo TaxID=110799 RepID=A0A8S3WD41_PARAO|nr:unnamed protein product [Parnassius apollo]